MLNNIISLKVHKDKGGLRLSITDKSVKDQLKLLVEKNDIIVVEIQEIIKREEILRNVPVRGRA